MANPNQAPNRLHLNFSFNDRNFSPNGEAGRQFPTTPSTFPQPFSNPQGSQEVWGAQAANAYQSGGYFINNPNNPLPPQPGYQQANHQLPPVSTPGGASPYAGRDFDSRMNGLQHQFSHQNLGDVRGGTPRAASPFARQASPAIQRPRTAGAPVTSHRQGWTTEYSQSPASSQASSLTANRNEPGTTFEDEQPPQRMPEIYSALVSQKAKLSSGLVSTFFKDSVQRARDRNMRYMLSCFPLSDNMLI